MNTLINGNATVSRNLTIGINADIRGHATVGRNLRVEGWLDAPNIIGPCKGLYPDFQALAEAHPHPAPGWWAYVGDSLPAALWRTDADGAWHDTGTTGGSPTALSHTYDADIDRLNDQDEQLETHIDDLADNLAERINDLSDSIEAITHPLDSLDTDEADLCIADDAGNSIMVCTDGHLMTQNFDSHRVATLSDVDRLTDMNNAVDTRIDDVAHTLSERIGDLADAVATINHPVDVVDIDEADFQLADADGMVVLSLANGGITTANFSSETTITLGQDEICEYYAIASDGSAVAANGYACTDYIDCRGARSVQLPLFVHDSYGSAFYDADRHVLLFVSGGGLVSVPEGACYLRTTWYSLANQSTHGDFSASMTIAKDAIHSGKRPYYDRPYYFSRIIDQSANPSALRPARTTGVLLLPSTYSPDGTPTPVIVYCHGFSHGVHLGTWGSTTTFLQQKRYWASRGYAVLDCNGARDSGCLASGANNFATAPQNARAYIQCWQYVREHYNVEQDGFYLVGGSMGGMPAMQIATCHGRLVKAMALLSAHVNAHVWFKASPPQPDLYGLASITESAIDNNPELFAGLVPEWRIIGGTGQPVMYGLPPMIALYGANEDSRADADNPFIYHMLRLVTAVRNGGGVASATAIAGHDHDIVSGAVVDADSRIINFFNKY